MNIKNKTLLILLIICSSLNGYSYKGVGPSGKTSGIKNIAAQCATPATSTYLEFNNVRALIHTGGDMWWDLNSDPRYEVPKNGGIHSMFSGSLWLGGTDVNGQLRIAAQLYRQSGVDFWTGPLGLGAEITPDECDKWDKHFVIERQEVDEFVGWYSDKSSNPDYVIPNSIIDWPAHGEISKGQSYYLAPFFDFDGDGSYDPQRGDYPYYDRDPTSQCNRSRDRKAKLYGDHTLWWVFNDKGNLHKETGSEAIGMEIQAQSFAFATQDEINNMTFTNYVIVNRSTYSLINTYFGTNFDVDLGCSSDDFIGCDVQRGLGYCYNADLTDGNPCSPASPDYGEKTPAIGIDFFEGPYQDNDGKDNPVMQTIINDVKQSFTGSGKNDLTAGGTYSGTVDVTYFVKISDVAGLRDSFIWRKASGICTDTSTCTTWLSDWSARDSVIRGKEGGKVYPTAQELENSITVSFNEAKGHTVNSFWYIQVSAITAATIPQCDASINGLNFGDGVVDNERWGMRRFVYYDRTKPYPQDDPNTGSDFYNFLQGKWKNNAKMVYGGDGLTCGSPFSCDQTDFMFPDITDPCGWGQADGNGGNPVIQTQTWNEVNAGNTGGDRRFVHSAGPFILAPGAVNDITTGVVWMRAEDGLPASSVELVRLADDKAQALFDNCFKLLNGPDAPCVDAQELDREIILYLSNPKTSNNYLEGYVECDPRIPDTSQIKIICMNSPYRLFNFEGYMLYQLKDSTVSVDELDNPERAALINQCDIKNGVKKIINYEFREDVGVDVAVLKVNGADAGVQHTFQISDDQFATGNDRQLVNFKKYYFIAIAYAYNNYDPIDPKAGDYTGQREPFLRGRKNCSGGSIRSITVIPHRPGPETGGTKASSIYGDSPEITRLEGIGNGGLGVDITQETENEILANGFAGKMVYRKGNSPLNVKVVDPLNIKKGTFTVKFNEDKNTELNIGKVRLAPYFVAGVNYFEVLEDPTGKIKKGDKFYVSGTTFYDGVYTVYKTAGKQIYTCEHITCNPCSGTPAITGKMVRKYSWVMLDATGDTVAVSDKTVDIRNEQLIPEYGISLTLEQVTDPGPNLSFAMTETVVSLSAGSSNALEDNGVIDGATMVFSDNTKQWLTFLPDGDGCNAENWIRSGNRVDNSTPPVNPECDDYFSNGISFDSTEAFEKVLAGEWAPYPLASKDTLAPGVNYSHSLKHVLSRIMGVDLVITSDVTKWSRSVVLEMEEDAKYSEGKVPKFSIRSHASINKNGISSTDTTVSTDPANANYIALNGMGWFPGYAINVETGERLNIMYGENSRLKTDLHGDDMLWNPSSSLSSPTGQQALDAGFCDLGNGPGCPFWAGGMHYIYIVGNDITGQGFGTAYDGCSYIQKTLAGKTPASNAMNYYKIFKDVMWVGEPLLAAGFDITDPQNIPTDVRIRLRTKKPFTKFAQGTEITAFKFTSAVIDTAKYYYVSRGHAKHNGIHYYQGSVFLAQNTLLELDSIADSLDKKLHFVRVVPTINQGNPLFSFSLDEFETRLNDADQLKSALDLIGVVPNPYYGMSAYETSPVDNRAKIINLPKRCVVSIYNISGTLIRQYDRDDATNTYIDWDLKNANGVPVSSGVYIIHVLVPDVGVKVLKWFGVLRPVDLESF